MNVGWNLLAHAGAKWLGKLSKKGKSDGKKKLHADALKPVDQVKLKSYIGQALREVRHESCGDSDPSSDNPLETSSLDSPSDSSGSHSSSLTGSESGLDAQQIMPQKLKKQPFEETFEFSQCL